jgi:hypothetical protein
LTSAKTGDAGAVVIIMALVVAGIFVKRQPADTMSYSVAAEPGVEMAEPEPCFSTFDNGGDMETENPNTMTGTLVDLFTVDEDEFNEVHFT